MAFTLEKGAHELLSDYLSGLGRHYSPNANRAEILAEIDSRIAELLIEKGYKDRVVTLDVVQVIIDTLGRPEDIDGDGPADGRQGVRKRIFRDPDNKVLGGVCGGLGAYFSVDPVIFRVVFAAWFCIFLWLWMFEDEHFFGFAAFGFLVYACLWICIPKARTMEERYNMRGGSMSIKDIQQTMERESREPVRSRRSGFWSAFGRCLGVAVGVILFMTGMAGSIAGVLAVLGVGIWNCFYPLGISWLLSVVADVPVWTSTLITIFACVLVTVPFVAMLYAGILLIFRLKSPKWRPGLIMLIIWVVSLLGVIFLSLGNLGNLGRTDYRYSSQELPAGDTLFIEFSGYGQWKDDDVFVEAGPHSYELAYMGDRDGATFLTVYPKVKLYRADTGRPATITSSTEWLTSGMTLDSYQHLDESTFWSFDGRTLRLDPVIFSTDVRLTDMDRNIRLNVSDSTVVQVRQPVFHQFDRSFDFCTNNFLGMIMDLD